MIVVQYGLKKVGGNDFSTTGRLDPVMRSSMVLRDYFNYIKTASVMVSPNFKSAFFLMSAFNGSR